MLSAGRSDHSRASSTSWPTCTSRSNWPVRTPITAPGRCTPSAAELPIAASVARIAACEAGWFVTKENIQTHGGMGFTWQMDCHLYYRRAKLLGLALGGAREWKRRLISELRTRNDPLGG